MSVDGQGIRCRGEYEGLPRGAGNRHGNAFAPEFTLFEEGIGGAADGEFRVGRGFGGW